jgi:hypothetical protein
MWQLTQFALAMGQALRKSFASDADAAAVDFAAWQARHLAS